MENYLLAHDLGTSGNKASLYNEDGKLIKSVVVKYDTEFFNGNWAEQNPSDWWKAVGEGTKTLLETINPNQVIAVAFSGQMQGCICVDKNGSVLRPAIIWADQRAEKQNARLLQQINNKSFYQITGHRPSSAYSLQKLMWIKENEPQVYQKTYKMLTCKDYLLLKLTGEFVTDYSDASGTNALNLNTLQWSEEILSYATIERSKFPRLVASTDIVGYVTRQAARECGLIEGTPVVAGGGDGVCATVGAGCINLGDTYSCVGSSAWIATTTKEPIFDETMNTFNFAHMVPGFVSPCGTMQTGGACLEWIKKHVEQGSSYETLQRKLENTVPGANGLIFLPYLLGERSPRWNPEARAAFIGLKMEHRTEDMVRAVLEGVVFNLSLILDTFKKHFEMSEVKVIGGGARNDIWLQMMADVYQLPIVTPKVVEQATSVGAAIAAGVGIGLFKDFQVAKNFFEIQNTVNPSIKNQEKYEKIKPIFDESYNALQSIYTKLASV